MNHGQMMYLVNMWNLNNNAMKHFLIFILGFSMMGCLNRQKADVNIQTKPNIVFILTDDQAWNLLGKDGRYPFMQTPNLDRLGHEGMVFENAFVTTSLCSPSRASILTGCYAHKNGVYVNSYSDPNPEVPFLPKILQSAGYNTAFLGKWHMKDGAEPRPGFDYWLSFDGQGQYFDPALNENEREFTEKGYMTDILTDYAIRWIKQQEEKPFCVFLWHKAVHAPFLPAPRDSSAFSDANIPEYENWYDDLSDKPVWIRRGQQYGVHNKPWRESEGKPVPERIEPEPWNPKNPKVMNYLRALLAVDKSAGDIRQCLEELNILDNTMIVFGSDNGFFVGAHQRGDKRLMYEESLRIPLMVRYPKLVKPGSANSEMVLNIDIAPTLIELAGAEVPAGMQGTSLMPLLKNETVEWRNSIMYEYFQEEYAPGFVTVTGVRTTKYKFIENYEENDIDELYDLEKDPGEMNNVINVPGYQNIKLEMKAELEKLKVKYGYFNPQVYGH
jgi:N-acetylglucosamine-6-sulfatase